MEALGCPDFGGVGFLDSRRVRTVDELENRSGVRATGGSNPSPSANEYPYSVKEFMYPTVRAATAPASAAGRW